MKTSSLLSFFLLLSTAAAAAQQLSSTTDPLAATHTGNGDAAVGNGDLLSRKLMQNLTPEERLLASIAAGDIRAANQLLRQGADPNFQTAQGTSPLYFAIYYNSKEMIKLLIGYGANVNNVTPVTFGVGGLQVAANYGHAEAITALLDAGMPVDGLDSTGLAALHYSAANGNVSIATMLLDKNATVDLFSADLETPLYLAAIDGFVDMVELLISEGADVSTKNGDNLYTPIYGGVISNSADIVKLLIAEGADVNAKGVNGETPVWMSSFLGSKGPMEVLIDNGADLSVNVYTASPKQVLCQCAQETSYGKACNRKTCEKPGAMEMMLE